MRRYAASRRPVGPDQGPVARAGGLGRSDRGDNRLFVEAVLYRYRAGIPWRDLPERFGDWKQGASRASAAGPNPASGSGSFSIWPPMPTTNTR